MERRGRNDCGSTNVLPATAATSHLSPELTAPRRPPLRSLSSSTISTCGNLAPRAPLIKDELGLSFLSNRTPALFLLLDLRHFPKSFPDGWSTQLFRSTGCSHWGILYVVSRHTWNRLSSQLYHAARHAASSSASASQWPYPSYSKIISRHFSEFQRGRANSLISAASLRTRFRAHCSAACLYPTSGGDSFS